ncbi:MAG TPA: NAD-dependent epimerase/dehydratase family protein [Alphaproteobacteria bacterium]|nr:NAD-dependent epimerase/dehydratase family protein [Alphaproteobacteria bacterium]
MTILLTGMAGFIGFHCAQRLAARGETVIGVDNLVDYYDVNLKRARLKELSGLKNVTFRELDISDKGAMEALAKEFPKIDRVLHLAAQPGVRYSLINPHAYVQANIVGHLNVLEMCRHLADCKHLVYASSSSVYGGNTKLPFAIEDKVDNPVSLYAATKKADELMSHCYSHLYKIPTTGLRFFTVYGPWGRPDMAAWLFTEAILKDKPIQVFNHGDMKRDFTYIDDIVTGVVAALDKAPVMPEGQPPYRVYNIGNHRAEPLMNFIKTIEEATGKKAHLELKPMQPGDVKETYADVTAIQQDLGFAPDTPIEVGIPRFVDWYRRHYNI